MIGTLESFQDLERFFASLEDQTKGIAGAISDAGEEYQEFYSSSLARPGDEKVIEASVAKNMQQQINKYFEGRVGRIYWRTPFEFVTEPTQVVKRYDVNGPDKDFITDRQCHMDKNWVRVACYCRLYRAKHKVVL